MSSSVNRPSSSQTSSSSSSSRPPSLSQQSRQPYEDPYSMAYWIFYLLGIGQLFPWNAFITATHYYETRFCGAAGTLGDTFENWFSNSFMISNLIFLALNVKYGNLYSLSFRLLISLFLSAIVFGFTTFLVLIRGGNVNFIFIISNISVALCGMAVAVLQGACFGLAGRFPSKYTQAMMAGQGLAGLVVAGASLISALKTAKNQEDNGEEDCNGCNSGNTSTCVPYSDSPIDWDTFIYFLTSFLVLIACILAFIYLKTLPIYRYYVREEVVDTMRGENHRESFDEDEDLERQNQARGLLQSSPISSSTGHRDNGNEKLDTITNDNNKFDLSSPGRNQNEGIRVIDAITPTRTVTDVSLTSDNNDNNDDMYS